MNRRYMIRIILLAALIISLIIVYGCTKKAPQNDAPLFGLACGIPVDFSFSYMQDIGMKNAVKEYGIRYIREEENEKEDHSVAIETLVKKGAAYVFAGSGFQDVAIVDRLARQYPSTRFILIDAEAQQYLPNVSSVTFKQNEGSFTAGALSAMMTKTRTVGVLGGISVPVIDDFIVGFTAGVRYIDPNVTVTVKYITKDKATDAFTNPEKAYSIAMEMYSKDNCDIVFQVAGGSGLGVFRAAKEVGRYAVGVDADQDGLASGLVLTSMMKRLDQAIMLMVKMIIDGTITNKNFQLGYREGGVSLSPMRFTKSLIGTERLEKIGQIEQQIREGKLMVPSAFNGNNP